MKENLKLREKISFVLNGVPVEPGQPTPPQVDNESRRDQLEQEERERARKNTEQND